MGSFLPKSTIIAAFCALFILFELNSSPAGAFSSGMFPSRSGAPALGGFPQETSCVECHTGTVNSGGGSLTITAPANYSPGQNVPVTVTINQASRVFFGFELTALNDQGQKAGDLVSSDARTQLVNGASPFAGRQYIQHSFSGIIAPSSGQNSWSFIWKAPAQSAGRVTFYAAGNASNADGGTTGDLTYTTSRSINSGSTPAPTPTPVGQFTSASAASFVATVPLPPNGIVAGFGTGLSANTAFAATLPLPTSLAGVEVLVRDANSQTLNAGLFFVSANQINYLVPAGVANGAATITVRRNGVNIAQGIGNIDTISPGLFTANVSGQGVAAAVILRRRNGVDSFEPVAQFNSTASRFDPIQIDLGTDADQVFLIAFGSGFRAAAQTALSATIGGTPSPFVVSAPAPGFVGLDQVNMLIPRSLIGRKLVDVLFKVADRTANTVQISVK